MGAPPPVNYRDFPVIAVLRCERLENAHPPTHGCPALVRFHLELTLRGNCEGVTLSFWPPPEDSRVQAVISGHLEEWASVPSFLPISWGPKPEPVQWLVAGDILPAEMALEEGPGPLRTPILEPHLRVELRASQPWSEAAEMAVRRELFR